MSRALLNYFGLDSGLLLSCHRHDVDRVIDEFSIPDPRQERKITVGEGAPGVKWKAILMESGKIAAFHTEANQLMSDGYKAVRFQRSNAFFAKNLEAIGGLTQARQPVKPTEDPEGRFEWKMGGMLGVDALLQSGWQLASFSCLISSSLIFHSPDDYTVFYKKLREGGEN